MKRIDPSRGAAIAQWIRPPQVRVPCSLSMLLSFIVFVLYLSCEKNKNKQKEAGFGPYFKLSFENILNEGGPYGCTVANLIKPLFS